MYRSLSLLCGDLAFRRCYRNELSGEVDNRAYSDWKVTFGVIMCIGAESRLVRDCQEGRGTRPISCRLYLSREFRASRVLRGVKRFVTDHEERIGLNQ